MSTLRLDKLLARHGFGTRSGVKKLLRALKVQVNGSVCTCADTAVDPEKDIVSVEGQKISVKTHIYLMINKPQGTLCSSRDGAYRSFFSLLPKELNRRFLGGELHIAGRLDADTEGLVFCTTDGDVTHRIISPKRRIPKTYFVLLRDKAADREDYVRSFERGIDVPPEGSEPAFRAQSARLVWLGENDASCTLTIFEGKYHQVKRMFAALGNKVVFLKRLSIGSLQLDPALEAGCWRELTEEERNTLFKELGKA